MEYIGEENLKVMKLSKNYNAFLTNLICDEITKLETLHIVDFGSGDGYYANKVSENLDTNVTCVEIASNLEKYYTDKNNLTLIKSIEKIPDNSVDYIYSLNVFEHIDDEKPYIETFYKKLKTGGKIMLYLPAFQVLFSSMDEAVGHYKRYHQNELIALFNQEQFTVKKCFYADFMGFFATLAYKVIGNKDGSISPLSIKIFDKLIFPFSRLFDKLTGGKILGKNVCIVLEKK